MFIGHFAVGIAAKRAAPVVSLGTLFLACQFADLLWPILLLIGIEEVRIQPGVTAMTPLDFVSYPYSHSLTALRAIVSKIGCTSVGDPLIVDRISEVAVCCSSASVSARFRAPSSWNNRTFSRAITAWSANVDRS